MLNIMLPETDGSPAVKLSLEHSLVSLSKWEALHEKPFFGHEPKTEAETESYVRQMILDEDPPEDFFSRLTRGDFEKISDYINSDQTATTFGMEPKQRGAKEVITSELIYFWLVQFQIPFHPVETWHLNRLMVLVKVAGIKNSKPKKMSKNELAEQYRALNEQRRKQTGSAG